MLEYGFIRIASAIPAVNVADCDFNTESILDLSHKAYDQGVEVVLFPELSIPAYTCGDLFYHDKLLKSIEDSIEEICKDSENMPGMLIVVGAALKWENRLFNCAVVIQDGDIVGVVPKTHIPNYGEFYEQRWFASASALQSDLIKINDNYYPFATNLIFEKDLAKISVEICEDVWTPIPPSSLTAMAGANVILNMSASTEAVGKNKYLKSLIKQQSARIQAAYVYSSSGYGESTTDVVFAGNALIYDAGHLETESKRFSASPQLAVADIDIERLEINRRQRNTFVNSDISIEPLVIPVATRRYSSPDCRYLINVPNLPFVPTCEAVLYESCEEIVNIQTMGLMKRLEITHSTKLVVGISGGLDSTLALLVAVNAFDRLGLDRKGVYGITMPGFGTTDRTYSNALSLMRQLGVTIREIPIRDAVVQHFRDIEHDLDIHDTTYENSQARERTQILMDYANKISAMVLGTGDLSELVLGWATYNGDHMSMYGVNAGVPKTLVKFVVKWFAETTENELLKETLLDVVDTPISPELIPADEDGNIKQKTEDLVGPYELHDFFIYYTLRFGFSPKKIFFLAQNAFAGNYDDETIKKWLKTFYRRFFTQQFKRSCLPDGPKVGRIALSPRGDLRMPSDASVTMWLKECEQL